MECCAYPPLLSNCENPRKKIDNKIDKIKVRLIKDELIRLVQTADLENYSDYIMDDLIQVSFKTKFIDSELTNLAYNVLHTSKLK